MSDGPSRACTPPRDARRAGAVSRLSAVAVLMAMVGALAGCGGDGTSAATDASVVEVPVDAPALDVECPEPQDQLAVFGSAIVGTARDGEVIGSCLLLADRASLRSQGLMAVTDLGPFDGMLFAYDATSDGGYWMRNTPMPLSIAWIAPDGAVVATADMEPCLDPGATCPSTRPGGDYRWAIEVPQGGLAALGLVEGARLDVSGWPVGMD